MILKSVLYIQIYIHSLICGCLNHFAFQESLLSKHVYIGCPLEYQNVMNLADLKVRFETIPKLKLFNDKKRFNNLIPHTLKKKVNDAKPPSHLSFIAKKEEGGSKFLLRSKLSFGS